MYKILLYSVYWWMDVGMPSSKLTRRVTAFNMPMLLWVLFSVGMFRGWLQHVLDHCKGKVIFLMERCWINKSFWALKRKTLNARWGCLFLFFCKWASSLDMLPIWVSLVFTRISLSVSSTVWEGWKVVVKVK